ncbi:MFS transporter [Humisphaera borealis]|uniref:MFS transporter n=1 Tax=Humisphaera borealis TaxID=2807512 RepID=A0A7M2WXW8_9BACT|nr:MFS transporter [Humisphaera borealis]QOV90259.1 MFS transporter [Humisphaera borealis]
MPTDSRVSDPPVGGSSSLTAEALPLSQEPTQRASRFRWVVLVLVFLAITINYVDRMVIGLLAPDYLKQPKGPLSESEFGYIGTAFGLSYALGQVLSGRWLDRVGVRMGYAVALAAWSIASMLHAVARTAVGFGFMRSLLGLTESPAYPAATKTLAEWFPKKERALAMGVANAGANVGAVIAPIVVPLIALHFGWRSAFVVTGAVGLVWLLLWIPLYRRPEEHPRVNAAELAHINSDPPESTGKIRWASLITYRQSWAFMIGKAVTDPVWSFYLFWLPSFLKKNHNITGTDVILPMAVAYIMADVGSIAGGWLSSTLMHRGWGVNSARKVTLLTCALMVVPVIAAVYTTHLWVAVILVGTALAAHQGFSSNLYTLVSDMFPKRAVASVAGLGGMCGYLGFGLFSAVTGIILERNGQNYTPVFIVCGLAYLLAFAAIHLLAPKLEQAEFPEEPGFEVVPPPPR